MRPYETIQFTKADGIALIVLDRPGRHNAYNLKMRDDLFEVFRACAVDDEIRVVVLKGSGPSFCSGADLSEFGQAPSPFEARRIRFGRDVWHALWSIPVPVIAVLQGHAIGTGIEMALLCDVRIADHTLRIRMPEARIGLVPAAGGTQTIARDAGISAATELLLTGRSVTAQEARALGLVDRLVTPDRLDAEVSAVVKDLLECPTRHAKRLKRCLRLGTELSLTAAIREERRIANTSWEAPAL